jgi:hypothetical protein
MKFFYLTCCLLFCIVFILPAQNVLIPGGTAGIGTASSSTYTLEVNGASKFSGLGNFGDGTPDQNPYSKGIQIVRPADQGDNAFHLSFIREGQIVTGMGFLKNSNTFAIQRGFNNTINAGIFLASGGNVGIGELNPTEKLMVSGNIALSGTGAYIGTALTDRFTHDGKPQPHYGMQWVMDSWTAAGPTMWTSAYGGMKFFTTGNVRMSILDNGNVGIGTTAPGPYKLAVEGTIGARKLKITGVTPWADYVFEPDYHLPSLYEVEQYIAANKHLPDVPSAAEVAKEGVDVGEMNKILLQKIEEQTLYLIELKKELNKQQALINQLMQMAKQQPDTEK